MKVLEASKSFVAFASTCNVSGQHARTHCLPSTPVPNKKRAADGLMSRIIKAKLFWTHSNPLLPWKDFAKNCLEAIKEYKRGHRCFPNQCCPVPRVSQAMPMMPGMAMAAGPVTLNFTCTSCRRCWPIMICHYPATALRMNGQEWYEVINFTFSTQSRSQGLKIWHGLEAQICSIMLSNIYNIYIYIHFMLAS